MFHVEAIMQLTLLLLPLISLAAACDEVKTYVLCGNLGLNFIQPASPYITLMDYTNNIIAKLTNDTFISFPNLEHLYLPDNKITDIEIGAFSPTTNLELVDLTNNKLLFLHPNTFKDNIKLNKVILNDNPLGFPQLVSTSIEILHCDGCRYIEITEYTFSKCKNIRTLSLIGTPICPFNVDVGSFLERLKNFTLTRNGSARCFSNETYPGLVHLLDRGVNLGNNSVFCLNPKPEISDECPLLRSSSTIRSNGNYSSTTRITTDTPAEARVNLNATQNTSLIDSKQTRSDVNVSSATNGINLTKPQLYSIVGALVVTVILLVVVTVVLVKSKCRKNPGLDNNNEDLPLRTPDARNENPTPQADMPYNDTHYCPYLCCR